MKRFIGSVVLLALFGLVPTAHAQICPAEGPQVAVYFDAEGTVRAKDNPGAGAIEMVYVYGEGFPAAFLSGIQYSIDYGPCLQWLADVGTPPVTIGSSPSGIAIGFGSDPQPGEKFLIHSARVMWTDCEGENLAGPTATDHPFLGPIAATRYPDNDLLSGDGARSQINQRVQSDIRPGNCNNPFNVKLWQVKSDAQLTKGGTLTALVLGSPSVNTFLVDQGSLKIEGVPAEFVQLKDIASWDSDPSCPNQSVDGMLDLKIQFRARDLAAAIPQGEVGDVIPIRITGCYIDGLPFTATDFITVIGNPNEKVMPSGGDAVLGFPNPNPFNPVTRFTYSIPSAQHVRLAVYDVAGRMVEELVNEVRSPGEHVVEWDAGTLPSGVYFYRLEAGGKSIVRRATLLK